MILFSLISIIYEMINELKKDLNRKFDQEYPNH